MRIAKSRWIRAAGAAALGMALLMPSIGFAQVAGTAPDQPLSVLLFPAEVMTGAAATEGAAPAAAPAATPASPSTRLVQDITTKALRTSLGRAGVNVVVYDKRLPSIQRAVNEGTLRETDVAGPGDDPRKAQRLADIIGASEYITAVVEDYKFDAASRTATMNLSVIRSTVVEGATLGTAAAPGKATAPADVAAPRQEGSAVARATEAAAQQAVQGLFPRAAQPRPGKNEKGAKANK